MSWRFQIWHFRQQNFHPASATSPNSQILHYIKTLKLVHFLKYAVPVLIDPLVIQSGQKTGAQEIQWQGQIIFFKNVGFSPIWHSDNFGTPYYFCNRKT